MGKLMQISVSCPCGKKLKAQAKFAGKKVKCPACKTTVAVPEPVDDNEPKEDQNRAKKPRSLAWRIRLVLLIVGLFFTVTTLLPGCLSISYFIRESNLQQAQWRNPRPIMPPGGGSPEWGKIQDAQDRIDALMKQERERLAASGGLFCMVSCVNGALAFVLLCAAWVMPVKK